MRKLLKTAIAPAMMIMLCTVILLISHNTDEIALYTDEGKLSFNVNSTQITDDNGHELAVRYSHSLCRMNDLTSLNLLCDKELDFLGELKGITKLRLEFDGNTELLDTLPYMPELRDLTIVSYDEQIFLDKAFTDKLPNLEILYIWATMKNDFSVFAGLSKLTVIHCFDNNAVDIKGVGNCSSLAELDIDTLAVLSYEELNSCTGLRTLSIPVNTKSELEFVTALSQVEHLSVTNYSDEFLTSDDEEFLCGMDNLKTLSLKRINVNETDFVNFMPNLTSLNVYKDCISGEDVNKLEDMGITVHLVDKK